MQNNNSKLKTFIITFLIVSVLIAVGYFVFNKAAGGATKGGSISKAFSSLFGSSKQKVIDMVTGVTSKQTPTTPTDANQDTNTSSKPDASKQSPGNKSSNSSSNIQNIGDPASDLANNLLSPGLNPFPYLGGGGTYDGGGYTGGTGYTGWGNVTGSTTWGKSTGTGNGLRPTTKQQCEDGKDNDGDGKIDKQDPGCHYDLNASNAASYDPIYYDESAENDPTTPVNPNIGNGKCSNADIILTNEKPNFDKTRMEELLRDFYRLAPNLATKEDITIEKGNAKTYKETIDNADKYTMQCYAERNKYSPSKSMASGGKYMLEVRTSPLFSGSEVAPSGTFLPGNNGVKFEIPAISPSGGLRGYLFSKATKDPYNPNDIKFSWYIQQADGNLGGKVVIAHVLQGLKDVGITKYYLPTNSIDATTPVKYNKVLTILQSEVFKYMSTLKQARDGWANRSKNANALSDWAEPWANTYGVTLTKEILDAYLASGSTDEVRKVDPFYDFPSYPTVNLGSPDNSQLRGTGSSGFIGFQIESINLYKKFEDHFGIW